MNEFSGNAKLVKVIFHSKIRPLRSLGRIFLRFHLSETAVVSE